MNTKEQSIIFERAFRFGFLIIAKGTLPRAEYAKTWRRVEFAGASVLLHPTTNYIQVGASGHTSEGILLGEAFSCSANKDLTAILEEFLVSRDWSLLDEVSGRFVLLFKDSEDICAVQDPFGSRTLYYFDGAELCVASHAPLVGDQLGLKLDAKAKEFIKLPEYKQRGTGYLPGKRTMYANVKCLLPNSYLRMSFSEVIRFWPYKAHGDLSVQAYLDNVDLYFDRYAKHLEAVGLVPLLGLTGGVDTRAVIAGLASKSLPIELVTWTGGRLPDNEVSVVKDMVSHLKFPHRYIEPGLKPENAEHSALLEATNIATGYCRGRSRLSLSMTQVAGPNHVFIRGYGGEIVRGFYNRHMVGRKSQPDFSDLENLFYSLYKTARVKDPSPEFDAFVRSSFHELISDSYDGCDFFNYDILDIFYWEQRMGVWGANMHNEMDPIVYCHTGLNSRLLYDIAFSLPAEYRLGKQIMLDTTSIFDRAFADIGVVS